MVGLLAHLSLALALLEMAKKKRGTGSGKRSHRASEKITKTRRRGINLARRDDLVWADMQQHWAATEGGGEDAAAATMREDGKEKRLVGAMEDTGLVRSVHQPLNDDLPGSGQFYCVCCARYFTDAGALEAHNKTKPHKRKMKEFGRNSERPHTQRDAEMAAGMGAPDNGKKDTMMVS